MYTYRILYMYIYIEIYILYTYVKYVKYTKIFILNSKQLIFYLLVTGYWSYIGCACVWNPSNNTSEYCTVVNVNLDYLRLTSRSKAKFQNPSKKVLQPICHNCNFECSKMFLIFCRIVLIILNNATLFVI